MANYRTFLITERPFRVVDPEVFIADLREMGAKSEEERPSFLGLTYAVEDGRFWVGGYDVGLVFWDPQTDEEMYLDDIIKKHIAPGEVAVLKYVGHEKLRDVHGAVVVITSEEVFWADLDSIKSAFLDRCFILPFRRGYQGYSEGVV